MFMTSRQLAPTGPFKTAICVTVICSIFLLVGLSLTTYGYVKNKDADVYSQTPITSISDIKHGKVVKLLFDSQRINTFESPYSKLSCVFYQLQYIHFEEDSDGAIDDYLDKTITQPALLTLDSKDKKYLVSLVNPKASVYFKNTFTYLKDPKTQQYNPTTKLEFSDGDKIIKENLISPGEEILVFGKVKKIVPAVADGLTTIEFQYIELPDPFIDIGLFYEKLTQAALSNELTSFIISTKSESSLDNDLHDIGETTGLIIFGLVFTIVPLIIILGVWYLWIKSIFKFL